MTLLLALLALSYVGSMLMRGRGLRGYGLPSGSEWLLLGLLIGPHGLRMVEPGDLRAWDPLAAVALSWLALVIGASFGRGRTAGGFAAALLGIALASVSAALVSFAVYVAAGAFGELHGDDRLILAAGIGLVSCETTQHAVSWVVERHAARGPLSQFVSNMANYDDVVPLLLLAVPFALQPAPPLGLPVWAWSAAPLLLGLLLGATAAVLLNFEKHPQRGWGVVLGAALLSAGIAWRVGLSPLTTTVALGATMVAFSRHARLRAMLGRTEHAVLLPSLLLAGASARVLPSALLLTSLAVAFTIRVALRLMVAPLVARLAQATPRPGFMLGLGLLPTGAVTVMVGLTFALRFPESAGPYVLCAALVQTLLGEALGPAALRIALQRSGEIAPSLAPPPAQDDSLAQSPSELDCEEAP